MIRKAIVSDLDYIASLIMMSSALVFADILESDDYGKQISLLKEFIMLPDNKFSLNNIIVYEKDKQAIGVLVFYDSKFESKFNENMQILLKKQYDIDYVVDIEAYPNSIYLDSLAVNSNFQKMGIAKELIQFVKKQSHKDLSLLVETTKPYVEQFYYRFGFNLIKEQDSFGVSLKQLVLKH
jgi:ribosomal protein S18 acetylase RimI-like enzyme